MGINFLGIFINDILTGIKKQSWIIDLKMAMTQE